MGTLFWFETLKGRDDLDLRRKLEGNIKTGLQKIVCLCDSGWDLLLSCSGP
jgi:hypothetical protein